MSKDERNILEVLQAELNFVEKGGYGRSVKLPWQSKSLFQDSPTCLNYAYLGRVHPCSECHLADFVPSERRAERVPCHFIPLNAAGQSIDNLKTEDNQYRLEHALKTWLRARIKEIETARRAPDAPAQVS